MTIQDIPNELVGEIFRFLSPTDKLTVSLTCKLFHAIVEPILYSSFVQKGEMSVSLLISTLLDNPHLAQNFKTLSTEDQGTARFGTKSYITLKKLHAQYSEKIQPAILVYLESLGENELSEIFSDRKETSIQKMTESWYEGLQRRGHFEYHLSLLLILLPNLENITVAQYSFEPGLALRILAIAGQLQRKSDRNRIGSFSRLKAVSIRTEEDQGPHITHEIPLRRIARILEIPSLRSFACWKIGSTPNVIFAHGSALEDLVLEDCNFLPQQLEPIMLKLTNLRTIKIKTSEVSYENDSRSWPRFVESFTHLHGSLEYLSLQDPWAGRQSSFLRLPPLEKFHKLRFLEVEADFLEDVSVIVDGSDLTLPSDHKFLFYDFATFPSSLKNLTIHQNGAISAMNHLRYNIENLSFLKLETILVEYQHSTGTPNLLEAARELSRQYLERGVTLTFNFHEERHSEGEGWFYYTWTVCAFQSGLKSDEIVCVLDV